MLTRFHESAVYNVLYAYPDLTRRTARAASRASSSQPEKTGPVLFSNSLADVRAAQAGQSPARRSGGDDGGGGSGGLIAIVVIAVSCSARGGLWLMRRRTADERE